MIFSQIGRAKSTSICELAKLVLELDSVDLEIYYETSRLGDIAHSYADVSKARKFLEYEPGVSLRDGLRALIKESALSSPERKNLQVLFLKLFL